MESYFLSDILKGKVVFVGVGNSLRADDGFGPTLIEKLKGKIKATCVDAGLSLENYAGKIVKESPDTVVIADATHLDLEPGQYSILKKDQITKSGLSTHDLSANMFIEYLESQTKADIYMLAVQPQSVTLGEEMSGAVKKTIEELAKLITEANNA
ncbi:MAG: hydrogenase 3 maturation endopeptidase HyCI [Candidatus Omnitrophota bacterium]|nr:MAG: hydrogenase 3 maturation endopeptidase HyCI [Candidatus Omnitrophota bacterium]